jgi:hypothetical protein
LSHLNAVTSQRPGKAYLCGKLLEKQGTNLGFPFLNSGTTDGSRWPLPPFRGVTFYSRTSHEAFVKPTLVDATKVVADGLPVTEGSGASGFSKVPPLMDRLAC